MREQVADCRRAGDVDFDVERLRVLVEPVVPAVGLLLRVVEELREAHGVSWDGRRHCWYSETSGGKNTKAARLAERTKVRPKGHALTLLKDF
jgi:hypothetical protein